MLDKKADLAGPGIGDYAELEKILPHDYHSLLSPKETQIATYAVKDYIEQNLCKELNLIRVTVPLIVDVSSGVNDYLDRDGSRTPVRLHISNDRGKNPVDAEVVQAATKWKRMALKQFGMQPGEGLLTDMRPSARTISSTTTTAPTWTSGLGTGHHQGPAKHRIPQTGRAEDLESAQGRREPRPGLFPKLKTDKYADLRRS